MSVYFSKFFALRDHPKSAPAAEVIDGIDDEAVEPTAHCSLLFTLVLPQLYIQAQDIIYV